MATKESTKQSAIVISVVGALVAALFAAMTLNVGTVREDQVGRHPSLQTPEVLFDGHAFIGKETVAETFDDDLLPASLLQKPFGAPHRFVGTGFISAQHDPVDLDPRSGGQQFQDRA